MPPPPPAPFRLNWWWWWWWGGMWGVGGGCVWGGSPLMRAHSQKATRVTISISDLIQRVGGVKHMFGIWTYAWLPPSPAKHNLSPI